MKYAKWTLAMAILLLAVSSAWAGCSSCGAPVQAQCPAPVVQAPCPGPCPVVPPPCPQACSCPCPQAVPAAMGAGPAAQLECLQCPNFDPAYASAAFAQYNVIAAVTQYGMQRTTDDNLRDISGEINGYYTSASGKLQGWYGTFACAQLTPNCAGAQDILAQLAATPDNCFNAVYARTLSQLIQQAYAADSIAGERATMGPMREQAQFLSGKERDWTMRLDRWVTDHGQAQ